MAVASGQNNVALTLIPAGSVGPVPALNGSTLRYEDMGAANGGVARDTFIAGTFVDIYNKTISGGGLLYGFDFGLEGPDQWYFRLIIDGVDLWFGATGIYTADMESSNIYGIDKAGGATRPYVLGFSREGNIFRYQGPGGYPIAFTSSIVIKAKTETLLLNKRFRGGFLVRS